MKPQHSLQMIQWQVYLMWWLDLVVVLLLLKMMMMTSPSHHHHGGGSDHTLVLALVGFTCVKKLFGRGSSCRVTDSFSLQCHWGDAFVSIILLEVSFMNLRLN